MSKRTHQFWQHHPSGCTFAVEMDDTGKPLWVSDDLHYSEVKDGNGNLKDPSAFNFDTLWGEEMNPEEYRLVE